MACAPGQERGPAVAVRTPSSSMRGVRCLAAGNYSLATKPRRQLVGSFTRAAELASQRAKKLGLDGQIGSEASAMTAARERILVNVSRIDLTGLATQQLHNLYSACQYRLCQEVRKTSREEKPFCKDENLRAEPDSLLPYGTVLGASESNASPLRKHVHPQAVSSVCSNQDDDALHPAPESRRSRVSFCPVASSFSPDRIHLTEARLSEASIGESVIFRTTQSNPTSYTC